MKIYSFLWNIITLLPLHTIHNSHVFEKTICVSEVSTPLRDIQKIDDLQAGNKKRIWIHFRSSHKFQQEEQLDNLISVDIPRLYRTEVSRKDHNKKSIRHDKISYYKYSIFNSHRFSDYISYDDYCRLESIIADIIQSYIDDKITKNTYGIVIDEIFLQPDSVFYERNAHNPDVSTLLLQKYFDHFPSFIVIDVSKLDTNAI